MKILFAICLLCSAITNAKIVKQDAALTGFKYPYSVKVFSFKSQKQELKMAYMDVQPKKPNGQTAVLLHGKNFSGFYWESTVQLLTEKGFRVVAPDQIGFGKSTKPSGYQFTFQGLAENTQKLLGSLKIEKAVIVGHSMGGMLATRFALMYPDLTTKLILINPIGLEDWKTQVSYKGMNELLETELKATPESIREYQKKAYYAGEWKPEYEKMIEPQAGWTLHKDYPKVAMNAALTSEMVFTQPVIYEFPLIKVPTLLIIGLRDKTAIGKAWAAPEVAEKLGDYTKLGKSAQKAIPNSKLVEIPGVGHLPQVEKFEAYSKALTEFIL